jgi:NAD(P)-dependent dehydrogenase (short-subunit alcohol dehydrogenase family)
MPLGRIGTLEDVASVGLFLASNAAKHLKSEIYRCIWWHGNKI